MRVTNNMLVNNLISNVNRNLVNMAKRQDELSTGKRVQKASDDPVAAAKIIKYSTDLSNFEQYGKNTRDAVSWMESTESNIMDSNKVMQRARELIVQASSGTNTVLEKENISKEIEQLKKQLITNGNFSFAGRYMFSGYNTQAPLFNKDGTFNVPITKKDIENPPIIEYQIGIGEEINISTNGLDVYGYVLEEGPFIDKMPSAKSTDGSIDLKSTSKGQFDFEIDYSSKIPPMRFIVDSEAYTIDNSKFNGSVDKPTTKEDILEAFRSAPQELPGDPTQTMSEVADIYFDLDNNLTIKAKKSGNVVVNQFEGVDLNLDFSMGLEKNEASLTSLSITDGEVGTNFNGKEFMLDVNGISRLVTISDVEQPEDAEKLKDAIQLSIDKVFKNNEVVVSNYAGEITFTTNSPSGMSDNPTIEISPVIATKSQLISDFDNAIEALKSDDEEALSEFLEKLDVHIENELSILADIGARSNRLDLITSRIDENSVIFTRLLSDAQDADISEVVMYLKNAENVYQASLSTGAKVIQKSLVDFIR